VIPAPFNYITAESVDDAVALLTEHGDDARLLAGGHSLLPLMKLRLAAPSVLIDIGQIRDLTYIRRHGDAVAIGALTQHRDLVESPVLRADAPLISKTAAHVGDPQIRNRGTIGGSLAHADPAADLPCAVLASDATIVVRGPGGRRTVAATDFFISYFQTAMQPDEMLVEIRVPATGATGAHYEKFVRRANDWAIVAVATVGGHVALANMANKPVRATATEQALAAGASIPEAAALAAENTAPVNDMHADAAYRAHLARVLTRRSLHAANG
jgi:aerobic carbon-monoxide dehydrogenase medium subunit